MVEIPNNVLQKVIFGLFFFFLAMIFSVKNFVLGEQRKFQYMVRMNHVVDCHNLMSVGTEMVFL